MTRFEKYCMSRPLVEMYRGYEIRKYNGSFIVDAAIAIYGTLSDCIDCCRSFIDELADAGIKQYDDEAVFRFTLARK